MQDWPQIIRISHLLGGCRATSGPSSKLTIYPSFSDTGDAVCNIPSYHSLLPALIQEGLVPIAVEYYESQDVINGLYPPTWISINPHAKKSTEQIIQTWGNLSTSAHKDKDHRFLDISSRISFQLKAIEIRLRDISESYNKELCSIVESGDFNENVFIESRNTFYIGLAIHSFLTDACTLRDYLAEYLNVYKYKTGKNISSHSGLLQKVLKKQEEVDSLTDWLIKGSDSNSNGWLAKLSAYRDLAVHSVPLAYAYKKSNVLQRVCKFGGGEMPSIFYPLPEDPIKIARERSKNLQDNNYEDYWSRLYSISGGIDQFLKMPDALEYCWKVNGYLSNYANECSKLSPHKPKMFELNESNIIGDVTVHQ